MRSSLEINEMYVEIQLLSKHGLSLSLSLWEIASEVGCAVNIVRRHLALKSVPKYERKVKRDTFDGAYASAIHELARKYFRDAPSAVPLTDPR